MRSGIELARLFHETYERLAPEFGYKTREDTKEFSPSSPNGQLMTAVCQEVEGVLWNRVQALEAENEQLMSLCQRWSENCTGRHGSQTQCVESLSAECKEQSPHAWGLAPTSKTRMGAGQVKTFDVWHLEPQSETFDEPSGMEIAQREADEAAGDADPRDRVQGAK